MAFEASMRTPRGDDRWFIDSPVAASQEFVGQYAEFVIEQPDWIFNEGGLRLNATQGQSAWLRRKDAGA